MTNHIALLHLPDEQGNSRLREGDTIKDFRGKEWAFVGVTRGPEPGYSPKVEVRYLDGDYSSREFYATVFPGLEVL